MGDACELQFTAWRETTDRSTSCKVKAPHVCCRMTGDLRSAFWIIRVSTLDRQSDRVLADGVMKKRLILLTMPLLLLGLAACDKKKDDGGSSVSGQGQTTGGADPVEVKPPAPVVLTAAQRAEFLGFSQHLPQDTEVVMSLLNGSGTVNRVMGSELWKAMGIGPAAPIDAEAKELVGPAALFAREFTIAFGNGTGEQTSHLLKLNRRSTYFQMRSLIEFLAAAKEDEGSLDVFELLGAMDEGMMVSLATDSESGVGLFEKMNMPPTYLAFRATEETMQSATGQVAQTIAMMENLGEAVAPVETTVNDAVFAGYKLNGEKVVETLSRGRDELVERLTEPVVDRLMAAVSEKSLVVMSGVVGDYVVVFAGVSEEDLKLAADVDASLLATSALSFCDAYSEHELGAVVYGQDGSLQEMMTHAMSGVGDMTAGIRDGLQAAETLGDTRDLEALLRMVEDREQALYALYQVSGGGTVLFFEDGMKIESFGGFDSGAIDWDATNQLASLGNQEDVVMFANFSSDVVYDEKMRQYLEAIMETAYVAAMKFAELPDEQGQFMALKNYAQLFDTKFRPYLLTFWDGFSGGFDGGIGNERAWVMDLNGSVPTIKGVPQVLADEGKFPRFSMIAPVQDRSKLKGSWGKMNEGLTGLMAGVSEIMGAEIPMQKPISSEKDGYTSWFFAVPYFSDDFMPSVTVGDDWFSASTSKTQSLGLIEAAKAGGETSTGAHFAFDFQALDAYAEEMLDLMVKNQEDIGVSNRELEQMKIFTKVLDDLNHLTIDLRRENGQLRTSIHLKTR